MTRLFALLQLLVNLLRDALRSGWQVGRIILLRPHSVRAGWTRLAYGELNATAVNLLAALITLLPGTTAVVIDTERRELLLHLLDLDQCEATLAEIRHGLIAPLARLTGDRP